MKKRLNKHITDKINEMPSLKLTDKQNATVQKTYNYERKNRSNVTRHKNYMDKRVDTLIGYLSEDIETDHSLRTTYRKKLTSSSWHFFIEMSVLVYLIIILPFYSDYLKYLLVTGVFTSFIGLMIVIYKYVFNSPQNYYDLIKELLKWNSKEHSSSNTKRDNDKY